MTFLHVYANDQLHYTQRLEDNLTLAMNSCKALQK